jgi:hypothetical protein
MTDGRLALLLSKLGTVWVGLLSAHLSTDDSLAGGLLYLGEGPSDWLTSQP